MGSLDVGIFGAISRGAALALVTQERSIPPNLTASLDYLHAVIALAEDRVVRFGPAAQRPLLMYTDASFGSGVLRMGAVCFPQISNPALLHTACWTPSPPR